MHISVSVPVFFHLACIFSAFCVCVCVSTRVYFCVKETDRSSAAGDHSPETFISHYPERERDREGEREKEEEEAEQEARGRAEDRGDGQIKRTKRGRNKREKQRQ